MNSLKRPVLVLNRVFAPVNVKTVKEAISDVFTDNAFVLSNDYERYTFEDYVEKYKIDKDAYEDPSKYYINFTRYKCMVPEIMILKNYDNVHIKGVKLSRKTLYIRDLGFCAYTGVKLKYNEATREHIIPQDEEFGGQDTWSNVVLSTRKINLYKANRTPEQAGLRLLMKPFRPLWTPFYGLNTSEIPESWDKFIDTSAWRVRFQEVEKFHK